MEAIKNIPTTDSSVFQPLPTLEDLRRGKDVMTALCHDFRRDLLHLIGDAEECNVTDLWTSQYLREKHGKHINQSTTSQHLKVLRSIGVVKTDKRGKEVYYSINKDVLKGSIAAVELLQE